jgi:DNA-binding NarL/FixJ family response regulator
MDSRLQKQLHELSKDEVITLFLWHLRPKQDTVRVPLSIFNRRLSSTESVIKFLKEELGWSNKRIALTLKRSPQNIWLTYRNAKRKHPERLIVQASQNDFPAEILQGSVLEAIIRYLKEQGMNHKQIAQILKRDERTVASVAYRMRTP